MKIHSLDIYRYALPLRQSFHVKGTTIAVREGFVVELTDEKENKGYGEISPLPGWNKEDLEGCLRHLRSMQKQLVHQPVGEKPEQCNGQLESLLKDYHLFPSVRFGIEAAILNLRANARQTDMAKILNPASPSRVPVNGLLQGDLPRVVEQAKTMVAQGYHALKLKVGSADVTADIAKVQAVNEVIRDKAILRADANQAWDMDQAIRFGEGIGLAAVEYIEEPLADPSEIPEFFSRTDLPAALDESLLKLNFEQVRQLDGVEVLIIKPMSLGGIEKAWQLAEKARALAFEIVISSLFESNIGILALAGMAAGQSRHIPSGLDTPTWFGQNLLIQNPRVQRGYLDFQDSPLVPSNINFDLLTKI